MTRPVSLDVFGIRHTAKSSNLLTTIIYLFFQERYIFKT